ncbi:MAG: hypothetical protein ACYC1Q_08415, partial [Bacteroidia bacterium]
MNKTVLSQQESFVISADSFDYKFDDYLSSIELSNDKLFLAGTFKYSYRYSKVWALLDSLGKKEKFLENFEEVSQIYPDDKNGLYIKGKKVSAAKFLYYPNQEYFYMDSLGRVSPILQEIYTENLHFLNCVNDTAWFLCPERVSFQRKAGLGFFNLHTKEISKLDFESEELGYTKAFNLYDGSILIFDQNRFRLNKKWHEHFARIDTNGITLPFKDSLGDGVTQVIQVNDSLFGTIRFVDQGNNISNLKILDVSNQKYLPFDFTFSGSVRYLAIHNDSLLIAGALMPPGISKNIFLAKHALNDSGWRPIKPAPANGIYECHLVGDRLYVAGDFDSISGKKFNGLLGIDLLDGNKIVDSIPLYGRINAIANYGDTLLLGGNMSVVDTTELADLLAY